MNRPPILWSPAFAVTLAAGLLGLAGPAAAQTGRVVYDFDNVWVDPGAPGGSTSQLTGTFEWTYTPGDFENGSGVFTELFIPGYGSDISGLVITTETAQIEFSLAGNWHGEGVDVTLRLTQSISPTQPAPLDLLLSQYQIESSGIITTGTFVSGSVDPRPGIIDVCFGDGSGTPCPCGNPGASGAGCANSAGQGAVLAASGTTSVGADDLAFQVTQGPGPGSVLLFVGTQRTHGGSGLVFGDGLRCAGGAIRRLSVRTLDGTGAASWAPGLSPQGGWSAGDVRVFQTWYRDVHGSPCGAQFNTSQAVEVTFQA